VAANSWSLARARDPIGEEEAGFEALSPHPRKFWRDARPGEITSGGEVELGYDLALASGVG